MFRYLEISQSINQMIHEMYNYTTRRFVQQALILQLLSQTTGLDDGKDDFAERADQTAGTQKQEGMQLFAYTVRQ